MVIRPGTASAAVEALRAAEKAGAVDDKAAKPDSPQQIGMPLGKLHVLNGPVAGKELELAKGLVTLGKPGVQVAVISRRPQGYYLTHIEGDGENGQKYPIVNGDPIGAKAYSLQDHDIIELAGIKMEFMVS